jgi:hypothetical protein
MGRPNSFAGKQHSGLGPEGDYERKLVRHWMHVAETLRAAPIVRGRWQPIVASAAGATAAGAVWLCLRDGDHWAARAAAIFGGITMGLLALRAALRYWLAQRSAEVGVLFDAELKLVTAAERAERALREAVERRAAP